MRSEYDVRATKRAREQLRKLKAQARRKPGGAHDQIWQCLKGIVHNLIGSPLGLRTENQLRKPLQGVQRQKYGRYRIFYLASEKHKRAIILFVGYRRDGHPSDAYSKFEAMWKRGDFEPQRVELS